MDKEYTEWLESLKEGDRVAVEEGYKTPSYYIAIIKKITPAGKIRLESDRLFNANGWEMGDAWSKSKLVEITPDIVHSIEKKGLIYKLSKVNFSELSLDKLVEINKIIDRKG